MKDVYQLDNNEISVWRPLGFMLYFNILNHFIVAAVDGVCFPPDTEDPIFRFRFKRGTSIDDATIDNFGNYLPGDPDMAGYLSWAETIGNTEDWSYENEDDPKEFLDFAFEHIEQCKNSLLILSKNCKDKTISDKIMNLINELPL